MPHQSPYRQHHHQQHSHLVGRKAIQFESNWDLSTYYEHLRQPQTRSNIQSMTCAWAVSLLFSALLCPLVCGYLCNVIWLPPVSYKFTEQATLHSPQVIKAPSHLLCLIKDRSLSKSRDYVEYPLKWKLLFHSYPQIKHDQILANFGNIIMSAKLMVEWWTAAVV